MTLTNDQKELVEKAVPMAWSIINKMKYKYYWIDPEDLFQEAMISVISLSKSFDPAISTWCTFIYPRIRFAITDYVRNSNWWPRREQNPIAIVSMDEPFKSGEVRQISSASTATETEPWLDMERAALDMPFRDWRIYQELKKESPLRSIAKLIGASEAYACMEVKRFRKKYRKAIEVVV